MYMIAPLFIRSVYSLLSSMCSIEKTVLKCKEYGYKSCAIVDKNVLAGAMSFKKACEKEKIKPIYGIEFSTKIDEREYSMFMLAKNDEGYKNLMALSSYLCRDNHEYITIDELNNYRKDNFLCLFSDDMPLTYVVDKQMDIEEGLNKQEELFGKDYVVAFVDHDKAINTKRDNVLRPYLKKRNILTIALNRTYYLNHDDVNAYKILKCIRDKETITNNTQDLDDGRYLLNPNEYKEIYEEDDLNCTDAIASACNVYLDYKTSLPKYEYKDYPSKDYLVALCKEGLKRRLKNNVPIEYSKRLDYELSVILKMHFEDYFLVVYDFILYAKKNDIMVGPGRGCVQAGTLVYSENGLTPIEKINKGDKVYTHKGNLKQVTMTHKYPTRENEELYKIRTFYDDKFGNAYTANHKVLAIKTEKETSKRKLAQGIKYKHTSNLKPQWIEANKLEVGDYVVEPKLKIKKNNIRYIDLTKYVKKEYGCKVDGNHIVYRKAKNTKDPLSTKGIRSGANVSYSSLKRLLNGQKIKEETYTRIANYLLSKGTTLDKWIQNYSDRFEIVTIPVKFKLNSESMFVLGLFTGDGWVIKSDQRFGVCFNKKDFKQEMLDRIEKVFDLKFSKQKEYGERLLLQFNAAHPVYKEFLLDFWKGYNYTSDTKTFPDWVLGLSDDLKKSFLEGLWSADGSKKGKTKYTSVSWNLICKLKLLLTSLNIPNGMYYRPEHYSLNANAKYSKESWQVLTSQNFTNKNPAYQFIATDDYVAKRIFKIEKVKDDYVYDITVKDDHSYATSSFAAHNSAAGSLVAYCLGITDIDPIQYGLIFERFLNPERISMPDIDSDFPDDRRDEVIDYIKEKYGKDHVAHIITYGTLKAKQVIRDVGRVLNYSVFEIDSINKLIPNGPHVTLMDTYNEYPIFKQKIESDERYRKLFSIALKLEGFPRHESTHAAGIVLSRKELSEVVPIIEVEQGIYSTQYTMEHLEELGLIKMDILGIRNLGITNEIVSDINKYETKLNIKEIPLNDKKTFDLIDKANTLGIFQLESSGMMNLIRKFKPQTFEEIGIVIALFRPGPMENIDQFIQNKNNPRSITYLHSALEPILKETYGIIVYQEQIMAIARKIAGFTYGKADLLRRAMSKKKAEQLESLADDFIEGCVKNGYSKELATSIYDLILKFANYGFNKSHSIVYARVAYEQAYLKTNYPKYFYKALLNGVIGAESKTFEYIKECLSINQKVKAPSINESINEYIILDDAIIMPFGVCKEVGIISSTKIIEERERNGLYKDYLDAVCRLTNIGIERKVIENLIYAGAFDCFKKSRNTMITALTNSLKYANAHKGINLLDIDDSPIIEELNDNLSVAAEYEKEVLGFYFSYNPISEIKKNNNINVKPLNVIGSARGYQKGFGLIKHIKNHKTKNGDPMAFVDIIDETGSLSLVVMPEAYQRYQLLLEKGKYLYFEGNNDKESSVLVKMLKGY